MLWFDLAITPAVLAGFLFLLRKNFLLAGLALGAAALIKQTAGVFWLLAIGYLLLTKVQWLKIRQLLVGPLLLVVSLFIRLWQEDALEGFFNWVILYPATEWSKYPGYVQMALSGREWSIIGLLLLPLLFGIWQSRKILAVKNFQLLILFLVGALISVYPRFSFFHSQLALAVLVISYGHLLGKLAQDTTLLHRGVVSARIRKITVVFPVLFIIFVPLAHIPTIRSHWQKETRFYGSEDKELAQLIAVKVKKEETVFLLGLHSGLYAMADRIPPKPWTDNFGWYLEIPGVQEEVISRWQENPPAVVFWHEPSPGNWFDLGTYQPKKIVDWITGNYTKKEEVKPGIWLWRFVPRRSDEG